MQVSVPFYSQHAPEIPEEWRSRACGVTALKMALDIALQKEGREAPGVSDLIEEAKAVGGWTEYGWAHEALARVAHNHGVPAYREEFKSVFVDLLNHAFSPSSFVESMLEHGIARLREGIERGRLPIVSVPLHFEEKGAFHLVLLTGYGFQNEIPGFYYNDSAYIESAEGRERFVDEETFKARWRRLAIFIG